MGQSIRLCVLSHEVAHQLVEFCFSIADVDGDAVIDVLEQDIEVVEFSSPLRRARQPLKPPFRGHLSKD